jgi:isoamyl acetate esterase
LLAYENVFYITLGPTQPRMKVTLIGDSIRLNSQQFVRDCLPPRFQVSAPSVNCKSSHNVAADIRNWVSGTTADVVHINCGLHDIRYDLGQDHPVSSPEEYLDNLRVVFTYLAATGVSIIWATSTPTNEVAHNTSKLYRWYQADLVEYNRLSMDLALDFGFHINDMYGRLSETNAQALLLPDGVHFDRSGNELIGRYVADAIQAICGA